MERNTLTWTHICRVSSGLIYRRSHKKWKGIHLRGPTSVGWGDQFCTAGWNYSRQQLHRVGHTVGGLWSQCSVGPLHLLQLCYWFDLLLVHSAAPHHSLKFGSVQMQSYSAKITYTWQCGSIPSAVWPTQVSLHHQVQTGSGTRNTVHRRRRRRRIGYNCTHSSWFSLVPFT